MKKLIWALLIVLVACQPAEEGSTAGTPFLGGSQGLVFSFVEDAPPGTVYDGDSFPFDVVVRVENEGEFRVQKSKMFIDLIGFEPRQFGKGVGELSQSPKDDIQERRKDAQGNIIESPVSFVEFRNLRYKGALAGAELAFPMRAEACYLYGTIATTRLCARENVLNPAREGICEVNANKEVFNSGAPVQITSMVESARAQDKIAFTFKVTHVGTGRVFEKGKLCDTQVRGPEDRVFVEVSSPVSGVECSGLSTTGSSGFATLYGGSATITCTQPLAPPRDYEFPVTVTLTYDYRDAITTNLIVKHAVG